MAGSEEEPRSLAEHVAASLEDAPLYVREIFQMIHDMNERRALAGLEPVDGEGHPLRGRTLGEFLYGSDKNRPL